MVIKGRIDTVRKLKVDFKYKWLRELQILKGILNSYKAVTYVHRFLAFFPRDSGHTIMVLLQEEGCGMRAKMTVIGTSAEGK